MTPFGSGTNIPTSNEGLRLCLGHKSALELFRAIDPSHILTVHGKQGILPNRIPQAKELKGMLARIEASYPNLILTRPVHVYVSAAHKSRVYNACIAHCCQAGLSNSAVKRIAVEGPDTILVSTPPFAFTQLAALEDNLISLVLLGFEICGTYQTKRTYAQSAYQVQPLASTRALRDFVTRNPSIRGSGKVRDALPYIADGSASPRETKLALILGLPSLYGGCGLEIPHMNYRVETDRMARGISGKSSLVCNLCWPEAKLDVEYQSREMHKGEASRLGDSRRANALASMGWRTIAITNDELDSVYATDAIADTIRKHLGKRRPRIPDYSKRRLELRRQLGLPTNFE